MTCVGVLGTCHVSLEASSVRPPVHVADECRVVEVSPDAVEGGELQRHVRPLLRQRLQKYLLFSKKIFACQITTFSVSTTLLISGGVRSSIAVRLISTSRLRPGVSKLSTVACLVELQTTVHGDFTITEEAPTSAITF